MNAQLPPLLPPHMPHRLRVLGDGVTCVTWGMTSVNQETHVPVVVSVVHGDFRFFVSGTAKMPGSTKSRS